MQKSVWCVLAMLSISLFMCLFVLLLRINAVPDRSSRDRGESDELSVEPRQLCSIRPSVRQLRTKLGNYFDGRYMSGERPKDLERHSQPVQPDKWPSVAQSFHTDDGPPSNVLSRSLFGRERRALTSIRMPWHCQTSDDWLSLGASYFPSFVKTTRCTADYCMEGVYYCREGTPRHLTVLKRRETNKPCVPRRTVQALAGLLGVTEDMWTQEDSDLREWRFVRIPVNVACNCGL